MNASSLAAAESRRNRRLLFLGTGLILFAIIITAVRLLLPLWYELHKRSHVVTLPQYHYGIQVVDARSGSIAKSKRSIALQRIMDLRTAWRAWAWKHRQLLITMKSASPQDTKMLERVYNMLPLSPPIQGMASKRFTDDPSAIHLSWQPLGRMATPDAMSKIAADSTERADNQLIINLMASRRRKDFVEYRDIALSNTITVGMTHLTLWVSGRVTESTKERRYTPGKPAWAEGKPQQIVPPFDFLTTNKGA